MVIPPPPRPTLPSAVASESQDLYDEFGLDDDVLAALDLGDGFNAPDNNKELDNKVSDVGFQKEKSGNALLNSFIIGHE